MLRNEVEISLAAEKHTWSIFSYGKGGYQPASSEALGSSISKMAEKAQRGSIHWH